MNLQVSYLPATVGKADVVFNQLNIDDLIIHFQPIISIKRKDIIGVEALARGIRNNKIIPPNILFPLATQKHLQVELDRLCRKRALQHFASLTINKPLILFMNIDPSIINERTIGSGHIINLTRKQGILPQNIVIEITERGVTDEEALKEFVKTYRNYGFLIAIDDVGNQYSNLDRIVALKPDLLKIDMNLIRDIDKEWWKSEVVKAIVYLAKEIGILTIAEGVETEQEALRVLELGVDMIQGFYLAKPGPFYTLPFKEIEEKRYTLSWKFQNLMVNKLQKKKARYRRYKKMVRDILKRLTSTPKAEIEQRLKELINNFPHVECVYILNTGGIQVTDTIFKAQALSKTKSLLFKPACKGDNLSSRDYFYALAGGNFFTYVTDPYISMATGNLVITIAQKFKKDKDKFILCVDIKGESNVSRN